jgi:NAD(P)-dependent dehydrogenase (short-subunit alcohol dehydrogenase family)
MSITSALIALPDDVVRTALFPLSDERRRTTGTALAVHGGRRAGCIPTPTDSGETS